MIKISSLGKNNTSIQAGQKDVADYLARAANEKLSADRPVLYVSPSLKRRAAFLEKVHSDAILLQDALSRNLSLVDMCGKLVVATPTNVATGVKLSDWDCVIFDDCIDADSSSPRDLQLLDKYQQLFNNELKTTIVSKVTFSQESAHE